MLIRSGGFGRKQIEAAALLLQIFAAVELTSMGAVGQGDPTTVGREGCGRFPRSKAYGILGFIVEPKFAFAGFEVEFLNREVRSATSFGEDVLIIGGPCGRKLPWL